MSFMRSFKARRAFLEALEEGDSESKAARKAGGKLGNFKAWARADENFAADWKDAIEEGTDALEDAGTERAIKKSDALMMFFLKARRPEKYDRGSKLELSGGVRVEGSRQTLLNKVARLQAQGRLPSSISESELAILDEEVAAEEPETPKVLALPSPSAPERGRKRRAAAAGSGRGKPT